MKTAYAVVQAYENNAVFEMPSIKAPYDEWQAAYQKQRAAWERIRTQGEVIAYFDSPVRAQIAAIGYAAFAGASWLHSSLYVWAVFKTEDLDIEGGLAEYLTNAERATKEMAKNKRTLKKRQKDEIAQFAQMLID